MGTHPIFESDFDCLTENVMTSTMRKVDGSSPGPYARLSNSSTPPPPVPTRSGSVRQLNNEMKSASLGRKTNPNEIDFFDKPLPDEPEKSNKRSALNRVISYILPNTGPKINVP